MNSWYYFCSKLSNFSIFTFIKLIFHKVLLISECFYQIMIVPKASLNDAIACVENGSCCCSVAHWLTCKQARAALLAF